jgi:VIT family protein
MSARMPASNKELHRTGRIAWLRAAVLGANDGILSTSSLVLGVAAAHATHSNVLVAGVAGLVAGAMSMAAGEYVSVHSQADTEQAELELERKELQADDKGEHTELMATGADPISAELVVSGSAEPAAENRTRTRVIQFPPMTGDAKCMIQSLVITAPSSMPARIKPITPKVIQSSDFAGAEFVLPPFKLPFGAPSCASARGSGESANSAAMTRQ